METRANKDVYIITPLSDKLDLYESNRIKATFVGINSKLAIDLTCVRECTVDFIESLIEFSKNNEISLFNIPAELFVLFNVMNLDKRIKLFVNELDFENNKRRLLNRNFSVV